jgi:hypothetical protein
MITSLALLYLLPAIGAVISIILVTKDHFHSHHHHHS